MSCVRSTTRSNTWYTVRSLCVGGAYTPHRDRSIEWRFDVSNIARSSEIILSPSQRLSYRFWVFPLKSIELYRIYITVIGARRWGSLRLAQIISGTAAATWYDWPAFDAFTAWRGVLKFQFYRKVADRISYNHSSIGKSLIKWHSDHSFIVKTVDNIAYGHILIEKLPTPSLANTCIFIGKSSIESHKIAFSSGNRP